MGSDCSHSGTLLARKPKQSWEKGELELLCKGRYILENNISSSQIEGKRMRDVVRNLMWLEDWKA